MVDKSSKPIMLVREDFINNLTREINESGLPPFVIEPILKDFLNETRIAMRKQYELEKQTYEKNLNKTE